MAKKRHEGEPLLDYAPDENNVIQYVLNVEPGLACNCYCPNPDCNERLIAKHCPEGGKAPHFAHASEKSCKGAYMSLLHLKAQQIIVSKKTVMAPEFLTIEPKRLEFVDANLEDDRWDGIRPDVVGETADGKIWAIEIFYTNKVKRLKAEKIRNLNVTCLEIDITGQSMDSLENFLLNSSDPRYRGWIYNLNYDDIPNYKRVEEFLDYLSSYPFFIWEGTEQRVDKAVINPIYELWVLHHRTGYFRPPHYWLTILVDSSAGMVVKSQEMIDRRSLDYYKRVLNHW